jgi:hypothetical protein
VDFSYPALEQAQPGHDNGGWGEVKVYYAVGVDPGQARVPARLNDGTPLLLDKPMGEGRILLLTSGLENLTNDMPLHPVFVAFVDRLAQYLSGDERVSGSRLVDSFVQLRAERGAVGNVEVIDPQGRRALTLSEARTAQSFRLASAGFYQMHFANGRDAVLGVNPDRRESDLAPMAQDLQQLWSGSSGEQAPRTMGAAAAPMKEMKEQPVSLWWYVMLLALIVALAETAFASEYMGTQREEA